MNFKKHIPITTTYNRHFAKRKIFIKTVYRSIGSGTNTAGHGSGRFSFEQSPMRTCCIENTIKQSTQSTIRSRKINGASYYYTI